MSPDLCRIIRNTNIYMVEGGWGRSFGGEKNTEHMKHCEDWAA